MTAVSQAEKWRRHREAFELAQRLGCTPKEAEREIARRRCAEAGERLRAKMLGETALSARTAPAADDFNAPWMMRN
jgi:hypothetical protein